MSKGEERTASAFKVFAWLCLVVGFVLLMLEAFLHYRHFLLRNPPPESSWSAVSIFMGTMLLLFGAGSLQFTVTQKSLSVIGYILPIVANAFATIRPGSLRGAPASTAPATVTLSPTPNPVTAEHAVILEDEARARREMGHGDD